MVLKSPVFSRSSLKKGFSSQVYYSHFSAVLSLQQKLQSLEIPKFGQKVLRNLLIEELTSVLLDALSTYS